MLGMVMPTPSGGECCDPHFIDKETETQGREVPRQLYTAWRCTEPGFESRLRGEFGLQVGVRWVSGSCFGGTSARFAG